MKAREIKPCRVCGRGLASNGEPLFYRIRIEPMVFDADAIRRRHGMETMLGPAAGLADAFEDGDIANTADELTDVALVCMSCFVSGTPVAALLDGERKP